MSDSYRRLAGLAALGVAISGLLYSVAFVIIARNSAAAGATLAGLFLLLGGILTLAVVVGLFHELREIDSGLAMLALVLAVAGALGSALHGGYDFANGLNLPGFASTGLPSEVDPRGLMTFGVSGLAILIFIVLMRRGGGFPSLLPYIGYFLAVSLEVLYLGRLVILDATNPVIVVAALAAGFVLNPTWYAVIGMHFLRVKRV